MQEQVSLAPFTYFKIGGPARFFVEVHSEEELADALTFAQEKNIPFWILGGGSNVLIADEGLPGLVIRILFDAIEFTSLPAEQAGFNLVNLVRVGAGVTMARAVAASTAAGLTGLEWAIGIPGTIGGSVRGNAGCFGSEIKDVIQHVNVLEFPISNFQFLSKFQIPNSKCQFQYRESVFKRNPNLIVLSATLQLRKGDPEKSKRLIAHYAQERTEKQDIGEKCAGCIFKNSIAEDGTVIHAGKLIDTAGCKSLQVGGAMVSQKHANYFINHGAATAADVLALIEQVKERVRNQHNITLKEEIQILR
jgi:UDP-N-acetylmuramate dehydrogenase